MAELKTEQPTNKHNILAKMDYRCFLIKFKIFQKIYISYKLDKWVLIIELIKKMEKMRAYAHKLDQKFNFSLKSLVCQGENNLTNLYDFLKYIVVAQMM